MEGMPTARGLLIWDMRAPYSSGCSIPFLASQLNLDTFSGHEIVMAGLGYAAIWLRFSALSGLLQCLLSLPWPWHQNRV